MEKIGKFYDIISGYAFKSKDLKDVDDIPVVKIGNISNGKNIVRENLQYVSNDLLKINKKYHIEKGDVLISLTGSHMNQPNSIVGRSCRSYDKQVYLLNQRAGKVLRKGDFSLDYIYYVLQTKAMKEMIVCRAYGAANQVNVSPSSITDIKWNFPSVSAANRIASILSTYDSLIENNTKRIRLLEKMAENLYKEWFVRFRFPGHEKVEMENGLPKGWTVEKVKDWCRVFTGRKDVNQTKEDGQYVFFSCSPNTFHSDEFIYDGKAILVAGNGSYTGRTRYFEGKFDLYQRTYAVVSNKEDDSFMFYLYLRFKFDFEPMHSGGTRGSAIPYIVMKDLTKYKFLYKEDIVEEYIKKVKPMFAEIDNLQQQNILLARQRDLLLPRLMSGKLEV